MTPDELHRAEYAHNALSNDLRFADAKALFLALVIGAWLGFVNYSVGFGHVSGRPEFVRWLLEAMIVCDVVGLFFAGFAIWPKYISTTPDSVHLAVSLRKLNNKPKVVEELRSRFIGSSTAPTPPIFYEESLLVDLARIGHRCATKYVYVRISALAGFVSILCGAAVVIQKLY